MSSADTYNIINSALSRKGQFKDYWTLLKPRINLLCLLMALGGMGLSPSPLSLRLIFGTLLGVFLSVGSANALNMYLEREGDKRMARTRHRPLAAGRIAANHALIFALVLGLLSVVVLWIEANMLTSLLSVFALFSYVCVYTPMKRRTPLALVVGAVPGAMPPLLGWTAARGSIDAAGLVLFAILLVWQIPHFIAISFYYREDYEKAGIFTVPGCHGDTLAKLQSVAYATLLVPISLMFVPLGIAGPFYFAAALGLGVWFAWFSLRGFAAGAGKTWARQFFIASLIYLPALTTALLLDISFKKFFP